MSKLGLNTIMMDTSSDEPMTPICCTPNEIYPPESFCYRNGSFPLGEIFTEIYLNISISTMFREFNCNGTIFDLESYPPKYDEFSLMEDGMIYVNKSMDAGMDYWLGPEDYCMTSRLTEDGRKSAVSVCNAFLGIGVTADLLSPGTLTNLIAMGLSLPCLVATFVVYTILPELNNVHGFTLRAYVASHFVVSTLFLIILGNPQFLCTYSVAIVMYFSTLANFLWLNVMCFDIWWTFRQFRSLQDSSIQGNRKKCIIYLIYAWGSSAVITGVGAIIDSVPTVPTGVIKPGLRDTCWLIDPVAYAIYLTGPIAVTMICNTCFFVLTAVKIIEHEKDAVHCLKGSDNQRHNDEKQRFYLYLKLFIVMGITCSAELVFWQWPDLPQYISDIVDLPNCLQGLNIFIIFVCKDKIKQLLWKRLGCKDSTPQPETVEIGVEDFKTGNLRLRLADNCPTTASV